MGDTAQAVGRAFAPSAPENVSMKALRAQLTRLQPKAPPPGGVLTEAALRLMDTTHPLPLAPPSPAKRDAAGRLSTPQREKRRARRRQKRHRRRRRLQDAEPEEPGLPPLQLEGLQGGAAMEESMFRTLVGLGAPSAASATPQQPTPVTVTQIRKQYKARYEAAKKRFHDLQMEELRWKGGLHHLKAASAAAEAEKEQQRKRGRRRGVAHAAAHEVATPLPGVFDSFEGVDVNEEADAAEALRPAPHRLELPSWRQFVSDEIAKMEVLSVARKALLRGEVLELVATLGADGDDRDARHIIRFLHTELRQFLLDRELPPFDTSEPGRIKVQLRATWSVDMAMEEGQAAAHRGAVLAAHSPAHREARARQEGAHLLPEVGPPLQMPSPKARAAARAARARRAVEPPGSAFR